VPRHPSRLQLIVGGLADDPVHMELAEFLDRMCGPITDAVLAIQWNSRRGHRRLWVHIRDDMNHYAPIPGWVVSEPDDLAQWYYSMLTGDTSTVAMGSRIARGVVVRSWGFSEGRGRPMRATATEHLPGQEWWLTMLNDFGALGGQVSYGDAWSLSDPKLL